MKIYARRRVDVIEYFNFFGLLHILVNYYWRETVHDRLVTLLSTYKIKMLLHYVPVTPVEYR